MRTVFVGNVLVLAWWMSSLVTTQVQFVEPNPWQVPRESTPPAAKVDGRDLSGVWLKDLPRAFKTAPRGAWDMTDADVPMTPLGQSMFDANKPSFGRRMVPPALGNDPLGNCDPIGLPRHLFVEIAGYAFEFVSLPDRVLQVFQAQRTHRTIWTDRRQLPKDPDPRWMGYSVGAWEGDTFVVESIGIDERTWLDHLGHPHSDALTVHERYRRIDAQTLEQIITFTDPKVLSAPWASDPQVFRVTVDKGLDEKLETFCVPSEEQAFNRTIRDPAAGVSVK